MEELVAIRIIKCIDYPLWLVNAVVVPKHNREWRMCIDYIDLNKTIPGSPFLCPYIDQVVATVAGHKVLCFLDAYKKYHQILMVVEDMEKTTFVTDDSIFCYTRMLFGLKIAQAELQQMVNKIFENQISRNIEFYVEDIFFDV